MSIQAHQQPRIWARMRKSRRPVSKQAHAHAHLHTLVPGLLRTFNMPSTIADNSSSSKGAAVNGVPLPLVACESSVCPAPARASFGGGVGPGDPMSTPLGWWVAEAARGEAMLESILHGEHAGEAGSGEEEVELSPCRSRRMTCWATMWSTEDLESDVLVSCSLGRAFNLSASGSERQMADGGHRQASGWRCRMHSESGTQQSASWTSHQQSSRCIAELHCNMQRIDSICAALSRPEGCPGTEE